MVRTTTAEPLERQVSTINHPCIHDRERGQGTVEYALVLLGAAAIALAVVAWVTRTGMIGRLFDTVIGQILQQAA